jgi:uncharacterized RmlC-like cupin family protein
LADGQDHEILVKGISTGNHRRKDVVINGDDKRLTGSEERWKHDGVHVIPGDQLDPNVPATAGMNRKAAINFARTGAKKLWAGTVTINPNAKTRAHHHGHLESVIYVVKGRARMRWGEALQFVLDAGPGDFIFVPPYVPHQEINASPTRFSSSWSDPTVKRSPSISILNRSNNGKRFCRSIRFTVEIGGSYLTRMPLDRPLRGDRHCYLLVA